jgi:P4 family phage/plasmid primase-like protien
LRKIRKNLEAAHTKRDIMSVVKERYSAQNNPKKNFLEILDSNRNLIVFTNGVYDLETHSFREGRPVDYMSMSVGYDYLNTFSQNYTDLIKFLCDIQPDAIEREFLLTYLSHALYGNMLEWFTILTGSGRNGKSKFIELIKKVFGNYYSPMKSQMLTRPQPDAHAPDPGLLSLRHKKIVIASEPEKRTSLNSGFIKFITGRDSIQIRECHGNQMIDFDPKFILFFVCNDIPDTDDFDSAFSKRVKCINFPTEFCDNPITETQKLIDTTINEKFDSWRSDFILLLIEYYKKYMITKKIIITDYVAKWTNQYKENTDIYLQFLNECTEESNTHIRTSVLYEAFKMWFKKNNANKAIPINKEFMAKIKYHKSISKIKFGESSVVNGIKNLQIIKSSKLCNLYSKVQIEWLTVLENHLNIKIEHAENVGERKIKGSNYKADGYCEQLNVIFEFHGCFWHGCIECYKNRNEINTNVNKTYAELYIRTLDKEIFCKNNGYKYICIWECHWNKIRNYDDKLAEYLENIIKNINKNY